MSRIPSPQLVALSFVVMLVTASPAAAQKWIPASGEAQSSATWAVWIPARDIVLFEWATSGAEGTDIVTIIEVWPLGGSPGGRAIVPLGATIPKPCNPEAAGAWPGRDHTQKRN